MAAVVRRPDLAVSRPAAQFLIAVAEQLGIGCNAETIRAIVECASGGQLDALGPNGGRASFLTISGFPFEVSVTGGHGRLTPAIRFVTETSTQTTELSERMVLQRAAVRNLTAWLPDGGHEGADLFESFLDGLNPDPKKFPGKRSSSIWIGVQHVATTSHLGRLKAYGSLLNVRESLDRLSTRWPAYAELATVPEQTRFVVPRAAALEVDARGAVSHKVYFAALSGNPAVPMKLIRCFGTPAYAVLSELCDSGLDPATLYQQSYFACRARTADSNPTFALYLSASAGDDLTNLAYALAAKHYGSTSALEAFAAAAETTGAVWRYSAIGLRCTPAAGVDKLNIYCTPSWSPTAR